MARPGEKHHCAKLTDAKVRAMRKLYWCDKICPTCLSLIYKANRQTVYDALTYRTWRHVKDTFKSEDIKRNMEWQ